VKEIVVGALTFSFPEPWIPSALDTWRFYLRHFQGMFAGIKAVDIVAVDGRDATWLIEVKDYRRHRREKAIDLVEEVAKKAADSLGCLRAAAVRATVSDEQTVAAASLTTATLRVVLHLEQPRTHSKFFPRVFDPRDVERKLRRIVRPIDPHARVAETGAMHNLPWSVT
jgi:hypothetical protein